MSSVEEARRTGFEVFFEGVDITPSLQKYFLGLSYTDNEEGETDDLQIKLHDRDGIWKEEWLNTIIHTAAGYEADDVVKKYKVTATSGVSVRGGREKKTKQLGTLTYGEIIEVKDIKDGWATIEYGGKTAYVTENALSLVYTDEEKNNNAAPGYKNGDWNIGDTVTVTGKPQYSSYGTGKPGKMVTNYTGSITQLNLKEGVPYPIHVGALGWFRESEVSGKSETVTSTPMEDEASKGLKIKANIIRKNHTGNGEEEILECGQFELDSVVCQGPPDTITIKGTSLPYHCTIRQTKKSKSWENYNLSGILEEIAKNNNMACMFESDTNTYYARVEQYMISDIAFLEKLCEDAGCSLKVTNNIIVIFDQAYFEKKEPVLTIVRGGGYTKYKLSTSENDVYTCCRVSYVDNNGQLIEGYAYADDYDKEKENQRLEISQKVISPEEANALADKLLRLHNKYEYTASFTYPGNPYLLAGCVVILSGWGAWDGRYIIKQAKHDVSSGYTTQINLRQCLTVRKIQTADGGNNEEKNSAGNKDIDEIAREVIRGKWGNGAERKRRLTEAGYDYNAVQKRVNELLR